MLMHIGLHFCTTLAKQGLSIDLCVMDLISISGTHVRTCNRLLKLYIHQANMVDTSKQYKLNQIKQL